MGLLNAQASVALQYGRFVRPFGEKLGWILPGGVWDLYRFPRCPLSEPTKCRTVCLSGHALHTVGIWLGPRM